MNINPEKNTSFYINKFHLKIRKEPVLSTKLCNISHLSTAKTLKTKKDKEKKEA